MSEDHCPHCGVDSPGAEGSECTPEKSPSCWELQRLSSSQHVSCTVWVTRGEPIPQSAVDFLKALDRAEGSS